MLLQLPKELLFNTLQFLAFQDRLNLVKTCRHLRDVISERHLYEELPIFDYGYKLEAALRVFKKYPFRGSQVKRITIKDTLYNAESSIELASVFLNIKEFRTVGASPRQKEPQIEMMLPWKNTLEVLEGGSRACIGYLLKDHLFSRLSSLTMFIPSEHRQRNRKFDMVFQKNIQFFDCFKNTPSLRHLKLSGKSTLDGNHLYVEHLEKLHEVCPQLTSLCLAELVLHAPDIDVMPLSIEPATRLLSLKFEKDALIYNARNAVLEYFIAKYARLTEFAFLGSFSRDGMHQYDSDRPMGISSDELVTQRQWFISSLPTTIKILQLNTDGFDDPLAALDESELDPTELAFYNISAFVLNPSPVIKQPSQLRYLQSLKSLSSLTLEWDPGMEIDNIILDGISHLKIQVLCGLFDSNVYHLDNIITAYPSLKSLSVVHKRAPNTAISLTGINYQSRKIVHASLRKLSIETRNFNPKAIEGIPTLFPNLKELELEFFFQSMGIDPAIVININGCDLDILSLRLINYVSNYLFILVYLHVKSFDTLKIYKVNVVGKRRIYRITEINKREDKVNMNKIRIMCDNIKMLNINNMDINPF